MNSIDILIALEQVPDRYIEEARTVKKRYKSIGVHRYLIAAIITLLAASMVYAIHNYRLHNLVAVDNSMKVVQGDNEYISDYVLSTNGYDDSNSYKALQEWLYYENEYLFNHPDARFANYRRPEKYMVYSCYSDEMVARLDEICSKYKLHPLGKGAMLWSYSEMRAHNLDKILSANEKIRCFYGDLFEDGSFVASGELSLKDEFRTIIQFQMHHIKKDAFYTITLGLNDLADVNQWNYTTRKGQDVLLAQNYNTGLIITETEDSFITVIISEVPLDGVNFVGMPTESAFLEAISDCFNY